MNLSVIGLLALALICAWIFGGIALRFGGTVIALAGLLGVTLAGNPSGLLVSALGACLWFAGHLHFRLRHGAFKSALVERPCLAASAASRRALTIAIGGGSGRAVRSQRCGDSEGAGREGRLGYEPGARRLVQE
jgi:hypothetical protein